MAPVAVYVQGYDGRHRLQGLQDNRPFGFGYLGTHGPEDDLGRRAPRLTSAAQIISASSVAWCGRVRGGPSAIEFAFVHPERTSALILS
jgi:hypothetical protein